jgi:hypothetical protein
LPIHPAKPLTRALIGGWKLVHIDMPSSIAISTFNDEVVTFLKATRLKPKRTGVQALWQNGIAERWVGSCRREILDHVIALNERHLLRLMRDYVNYYEYAS